MAGHSERWDSPFTQAELRRLWTYSDGAVTVKGYRVPDGRARAGSWVLADQATGEVRGVVPPGEFSRRFRPVDVFADVPGLPTYLGTDGPFWVMPALGPSVDEFNRRLARADGLTAEPDPKLGGAVNLVRPSLADPERLQAAQRATAGQRESFEAFAAP